MRTCVGYTGGSTQDPTYRSIGDHSEALQIEYDPSEISYPALLEIFWASHNPRARRWSTQYRAAIFVHDQPQEEHARKSLAAISANVRGNIRTPILQATTFYPAEDYHQKYYLQHQHDLWAFFTSIYPAHGDIVSSTAAARVNGLLGGHDRGIEEDLQTIIPKSLHSILVPE